MTRTSTCALIGIVVVFLWSCGPSGPQPGTPDWFWQAAHDTFGAGDYLKCDEHLGRLTEPGNPYADRAFPFRLILAAGLASGYMDVADAFENGSRANKTATAQFRKYMNDYRALANRRAVEFAEVFLKFQQAKLEGDVRIPFAFPKGNPMPVPELGKISEGVLLGEAALSAAEKAAIERRILLTTCLVTGAGEDVAKAQKMFTDTGASVPRPTFLLGMAKKMKDLAELYAPHKLDQPERRKLLVDKALEIARALPESDESKKLIKDLEGALKEVQKRLGQGS